MQSEIRAIPKITRRQREVWQLVAEDRSTKQIGGDLGISTKTAETHRFKLMQKLGFKSRIQLVHSALVLGITPVAPYPVKGHLTDRERSVTQLAGRGFHTKDIAQELGISRKTVEKHLLRIYRKLSIHSQCQIVHAAVSNGLVTLEELALSLRLEVSTPAIGPDETVKNPTKTTTSTRRVTPVRPAATEHRETTHQGLGPDDPVRKLTPEELEIWKLITQGYRIKEVVSKLQTEVGVVEYRRRSLKRKMGAHFHIDLTRMALARGLVPVCAYTPRSPLTRQEKKILAWSVEGKPNELIASELGLKVRTIENYRWLLGLKLGTHTPVGLVHAAIALGITKP